jgi:transcriptional regulator PpsR
MHPEAVLRGLFAASDIVLVVDDNGVIRDVIYGGDNTLAGQLEELFGRRFIDAVTPESRAKVTDILSEVAAGRASRSREINHPSPSGGESLPISYLAVPTNGGASALVIGRDLRIVSQLEQKLALSQQSMERDVARLRASELRYRVLFNHTSEAVVVAELTTRRVVETNAEADQLLGDPMRIKGRSLGQIFDGGQDEVAPLLQRATLASDARSSATLQVGGRLTHVHLSLFRQDGVTYALLRLSPERATTDVSAAAEEAPLHAVLDQLPAAFVMINGEGRIEYANSAFLDLAEAATPAQVLEQPLERWLQRAGGEPGFRKGDGVAGVVMRSVPATLRGLFGRISEVQISAARRPDDEGGRVGCLIIPNQGMPDLEQQLKSDMPRSMQQMTDLIGQVPLKELVRQTTDIIEKLCIETALTMTGDNRAVAAEKLGISRQSLYTKLNRFGITDNDFEG